MKITVLIFLITITFRLPAQDFKVVGGLTGGPYKIIDVNGKVGVYDPGESKILLPAEYDRIGYHQEADCYQGFKGKSFTLFSTSGFKPLGGGAILTEFKKAEDGSGWLIRGKDGYGFLNMYLEMDIPPQFDKVTYYREIFCEDCINYIVEKGGKKGLYYHSIQLMEPVYDNIVMFPESSEFVAVKDGKVGLFYADWKLLEILPVEYESIIYHQGLYDGITQFLVSRDGKYGLVGLGPQKKPVFMIPLEYDVMKFTGDIVESILSTVMVKKGKVRGIIFYNETEFETNPFFVTQYADCQYNMLFKDETGFWGVADFSDKQYRVLIPARYEEIRCPQETVELVPGTQELNGSFFLAKRGGKWGIINELHEELSEFVYNDPESVRLSP